MLRCVAHLLVLLGLLLTPSMGLADGKLEQIKKRGVLRVGLEPGFLPFEMQTPKQEWVGFDVEMIRAFAQSIGVKPEFIATKWDGIIPGLMAGKYDVITSGMTITEERAKAVLFSDPYYQAGLKVLLNKKSEAKLKAVQDLDQADVTVLVKLGTTGDIYASKQFKKAKVRRLDNEADAAQSILLGKADAFIYDKPYLEIYASTQKAKLGLLPVQLTEEHFGLAAKPGDASLVTAFNSFLKDWKAKGEYQKVYRAMFEELTWKSHFPNLF